VPSCTPAPENKTSCPQAPELRTAQLMRTSLENRVPLYSKGEGMRRQ
jgi:hypothetical protein